MFVLPADRAHFKALKSATRTYISELSSSHADEALAAAAGFQSYAALQASDGRPWVFRDAPFLRRLKELHVPLNRPWIGWEKFSQENLIGLGFHPNQLRVMNKPVFYGGVFVAGNTGSSRPTTLRTMAAQEMIFTPDELSRVGVDNRIKDVPNLEALKINVIPGTTGPGAHTTLKELVVGIKDNVTKIVVEDPPEYLIPHMRSASLISDAPNPFDQRLKLVMEADPDVIMVNEIRNGFATQKSVRSGQQIFSSVSSPSADGMEDRLEDFHQVSNRSFDPEYQAKKATRSGYQIFTTIMCHSALNVSERISPPHVYGEVINKEMGSEIQGKILAGQRIFCFMHASAALSIVERLDDFGLTEGTIGSKGFLRILIYQELMPVLCPDCSHPIDVNAKDELTIRMRQALEDHDLSCVRHQGNGCTSCMKAKRPDSSTYWNRPGYIGHTLCAHVFSPTPSMAAHIQKGNLQAAREELSALRENPNKKKAIMTPTDHAFFKMTKGMIDPNDLEERFGPILPFRDRPYW